jgi:VanZ family protein
VEDVTASAGRAVGRRALAWLAVALYAGVIFALSSIPSGHFPSTFSGADKLVHAGEYGVLGGLLAMALGVRARGWAVAAAALALAVAYGLSDEWHQSFVPGRQSSLWDVAADTVGAGLGIVAVRRWRREA